MANNNNNLGNPAFSGFPGGHDSVPGVGNTAPAATGFANTGMGGASTLGANLPHVDPNNFQGTVHWGPDQVVSSLPGGQSPFGGVAPNAGTGIN